MAEGAGQQAMGYILGKVEGEDENWHGHVTALTVAPDFRCRLYLGFAAILSEPSLMQNYTPEGYSADQRKACKPACESFSCSQATGACSQPDGSAGERHTQSAQRLFCGSVCAPVQLQCNWNVHKGAVLPAYLSLSPKVQRSAI